MQIQWETRLLSQIELHIRHGDWGAMRASVVDPAGGVPIKAGEYWLRAVTELAIIEALGRDPAAMTKREYHLQGAAFNALCAAWVFDSEVAAARKRLARHAH